MTENFDVVMEENIHRPAIDVIREWAARVEIPEDYEPETVVAEYPPARNFEQRQADRIANIFKRRHFEHMTTHGMSSMPRHLRLRPVRGGCFVDVFYTYAFIQMPFDSIRIARKYLKYMGLPLQKGE